MASLAATFVLTLLLALPLAIPTPAVAQDRQQFQLQNIPLPKERPCDDQNQCACRRDHNCDWQPLRCEGDSDCAPRAETNPCHNAADDRPCDTRRETNPDYRCPTVERRDTERSAAPPSPKPDLTLTQFVLYAEARLQLGPCARVRGGDLGVRSVSDQINTGQLRIGSDSVVQPTRTIYAPAITLGRNVAVGALGTSRFTDDGIALAPLAPFPAQMPPLPLAPAIPGTGSKLQVGDHQVLALLPGAYGTLTVYGVLLLNPGTYTMAQLNVGDGGSVIPITGNVQLTINQSLAVGRHARICSAFHLSARQFAIAVAGSDTNAIPAASIGAHSRVCALVAAPHGTLALGDDTHARGAFAAYTLLVGDRARITFEDGFPANPPGSQGSQKLTGYYAISPNPAVAPFLGPIPDDTNIHLAISLPVRDPAGLKTFLQQVSDPKSPNFRHYLSQSAFYATYGATAADYHALQNWATANGFTIKATYPNNLLLSVVGSAAKIESALHVNLVWRKRADSTGFVAVDRNPSIDLSVPILHISGLTDEFLPRHMAVNGTGVGGGNGNAAAASSYRAADLRNAYLGTGSTCQPLDGTGQVVGIVDFATFAQSDINAYNALQTAVAGQPPLPPTTNVTIVVVEGGNPAANSNLEATLDVDLVHAFAPNAQILFFQGSTGITGHLDDALNAMATSNPPLTVATSSLSFKPSDTSQQAIDEMAASGVSFFNSSGDFGDIGDPQDNTRMNNQTLVGGTLLATNALTPGPPIGYPSPYFNIEVAWNEGLPAKSQDVSAGGIMDGNNKNGNCDLFCGDPIPIPDYQVGVSMAANGGSTQFRNYPDVAMAADNIEIVFGGNKTIVSGTSLAAPLWAGFTALVNQRSIQNHAGLMGFLNRTIYGIGLTRGGANDLYTNTFNDVTSGNNANGFGSGFTAVSGYDLVTGWGSPNCALVSQLGTPTPFTLNTVYSEIRFTIVTGNDDAGGGQNGSTQTGDVLLKDGTSFTETLRNSNEAHWDNGSTHQVPFQIPDTVTPPLTQLNGIAGVRINLVQNNPDIAADNWDIADLFVDLVQPGIPAACQLHLVGTFRLQDGSTGLVRLSKNPGSSGVGPSKTFPTGAASGC